MGIIDTLKNTIASLQTEVDELKAKADDATQEFTEEDYTTLETKLNEIEATEKKLSVQEKLAARQADVDPMRPNIQVHDVADEAPYSLGEFFQDVAKASLRGEKSARLNRHQQRSVANVKQVFGAASGLQEAVPSDGGFLVGSDFSQELIRSMYEDNTQLISRVRRMSVSANSNGTKMYGVDETSRADGSRFGGVRGYWGAEAATITSSKPSFREIDLTLNKLFALVYSTDELLQDASMLESFIMDVVPKELNFKVQDAILNGDGAGKPLGILESPALVTVSKETGQDADTIEWENIKNMYRRLHARNRANAVWLANIDTLSELMGMEMPVGTGGVPVWLPANQAQGMPNETLLGRPILYLEQSPTLGDKGDIVLADLSDYILIDKGGVQSAASMHVQFTTDEMAFRFIYRVDGQTMRNSAITPFKGSDTISSFVTLAARA
jgi:HK97 family phage major capsid protein